MDLNSIVPLVSNYDKLNLTLLEKCKNGDFEAFEQAKVGYAFSKERAVKIQLKLFIKNNPSNVAFKALEVFYQIHNQRCQKAKRIWEYTIEQFPSRKPAIYYYTNGALEAALVVDGQWSTTVQGWEKEIEIASRKLNLDVHLQFVLASKYYYGEGVTQNLEKAKNHFLSIATRSATALYRLAKIAQRENQPSKAREWYTIIAGSIPYTQKLDLDIEWYHVKAHYALGEIHIKKGESGKTEAEWHYSRAAKAGHPKAQYKFGEMLLSGMSLSFNDEQGIEWIQKAALQGLKEAREFFKSST